MEDWRKGKPSTYSSGYLNPVCGLHQGPAISVSSRTALLTVGLFLPYLANTVRCQKKLPCETGWSYAEDVVLHTKNHKRNFLGFSTRKSCASHQLAAFCTGYWEAQSQTCSYSPNCQMIYMLRTWLANLIPGLILIFLSLFSWFSHLKHRHNPDSLVKNVFKWVTNKSLFSVSCRKDGVPKFLIH